MILLDTHVLVWLVGEPARLSRRAARTIQEALASGGIGIASITLWEVAMLMARGKLQFDGTIDAAISTILAASGAVVHPMTPSIAALSVELPESYPKDPADRIIGATARVHAIKLVTHDRTIRSSRLVETIW